MLLIAGLWLLPSPRGVCEDKQDKPDLAGKVLDAIDVGGDTILTIESSGGTRSVKFAGSQEFRPGDEVRIWLKPGSGSVAVRVEPARPPEARSSPPAEKKPPEAEAINKGVEWLRTPFHRKGRDKTDDELILYTLFHGGVPRDDPLFLEYLQRVVDSPPESTYRVGLAAMCLLELDRIGYRWKLLDYARFLVDTQAHNGQWSYGHPLEKKIATEETFTPGVLYGTRYPPGYKPGATRQLPKVQVAQTKRAGKSGDNSNTQYAALGLRACAEASIEIDRKCLEDALAWWKSAQGDDGSWGYQKAKGGGSGSMTAGGVASVAGFSQILRRPWKDEPHLKRGLAWLDKHWTVSGNPSGDARWHYYYLYGLERVGAFIGSETIGGHAWYQEGAGHIVESQREDGSWEGDVWNTCFAILFLRRATELLIYTDAADRKAQK